MDKWTKAILIASLLLVGREASSQVTELSQLLESSPNPNESIEYDVGGLQILLFDFKSKFQAPSEAKSSISGDIQNLAKARLQILSKSLTGNSNYFSLSECDKCFATAKDNQVLINVDRLRELLNFVGKSQIIPVLDALLAHELGHLVDGNFRSNDYVKFPEGAVVFNLNLKGWKDPLFSNEFMTKTLREQERLTRVSYYVMNVWHTLVDAIGVALLRNSTLSPCGYLPLMDYLIAEMNNLEFLSKTEKDRSLNHALFRKTIWSKALEKECK
jgi:hypothetical protein